MLVVIVWWVFHVWLVVDVTGVLWQRASVWLYEACSAV